ncbi:MAG: NERD domain-containing protein [Sporolactobacillus sp.]|jgi:hypothetical protein|nr:NERD domain-containing protein [Sporolactobacillus sp.]
MYTKDIQCPYHILQYDALLSRLHGNDPLKATMTDRYQRAIAGLHGEQSIRYFLDYLAQKDFSIFHNLRLSDGVHFFQIDWLCLSPRFFLILEVKNIVGPLFFNPDAHQLVRKQQGKIEVFDDPDLQALLLTEKLRDWLRNHVGITDYPADYRVVLVSAAQLTFDTPGHRSNQNIIRRAALGSELLQIDRTYTKRYLSAHKWQQVTRCLLAKHTPLMLNLFKAYDSLATTNVINGIQCSQCRHFSMKKVFRGWSCDTCGFFSKDAHIRAFRDYLFIYGNTITNKQCRKFLRLDSQAVAHRLLLSVSRHYQGKNRGRVYELSSEQFDKRYDITNSSQNGLRQTFSDHF